MLKQQLLLPLQPQQLKSFALFFPGKNHLALETLIAPTHPQFIYLFGASGSGKSHLLEAYASQAIEKCDRVLFLPLKNLNHQKNYLKELPKLAAVLVDDLEYLSQDEEADLFHLFNQLQSTNTPLIVTSNLAPNALNIQLPDLKSRLESGLALKLETLKDEELLAALKLHAQHLGLRLNEKIYIFILNHLERKLSSLILQLKKVTDYSLLTRRPVTIKMIKFVLAI
jgi:DnaA-homolog protein